MSDWPTCNKKVSWRSGWWIACRLRVGNLFRFHTDSRFDRFHKIRQVFTTVPLPCSDDEEDQLKGEFERDSSDIGSYIEVEG